MEVQLTVIDHLGLKMYTTLPPIISELIANSWDGESKTVEVELPVGPIARESKVVVRDSGNGMTFDELNSAYLQIGRDRRAEEGRRHTATLGRKLMGRKGIGKLSAFGVAKVVEVETNKNGTVTSFQMNIDDIRSTPKGTFYKPTVLKNSEPTGLPNGTTVTLLQLKRTRPINVDQFRKKIAHRF